MVGHLPHPSGELFVRTLFPELLPKFKPSGLLGIRAISFLRRKWPGGYFLIYVVWTGLVPHPRPTTVNHRGRHRRCVQLGLKLSIFVYKQESHAEVYIVRVSFILLRGVIDQL
jgi:hypothetical protein